MSEPLAPVVAPLPPLLHRVDDAIFAVERGAVVVSMTVMVLMVFFDVVARRLEAQESKLAALLLALGRPLGLRPGEAGAPWVQTTLTPIVGAALLGGLIWFGFATMRWRAERAVVPRPLEPLLALAGTALLFGLGWLMLHRPSHDFYALAWSLMMVAGAATALVKRAPGFRLRLGLTVLGLLVGAPLLHAVVPAGYSWAKEVAMILLVWTGFVGASMAAHEGRHIDIDFGKRLFPASLRAAITTFAHLITVGFCLLIVSLGIVYVFGAHGLYRLEGRFPHTGIPDWIVAFAIPWSFGLIGLRIGIAALRTARGDLTAKGSSLTPQPPLIPAHGGAAAGSEAKS